MTKATITQLPDPSGFSLDPLTEVLRSGARRLLEQAVEAELATLLAAHAGEQTENGLARLVRHGHLPEREVMTGVGPVPVKVPRVRDRAAGAGKIRFTSSILPPYLRKAKSVEDLLPWLYLKGISSGDFQDEAPSAIGRSRNHASFTRDALAPREPSIKGSSAGPNSQRCLARTRRACRPPRSLGSRPLGGMSMSAGSAANWAPGASSTSGRTGSISSRAWPRRSNAFWC